MLSKKNEKMEQRERIYGEDTGSFDQEIIDWLNDLIENDPKRGELLVYYIYDQLHTCLWRYNRDKQNGDNEILRTDEMDNEYIEMVYSCFYLIGMTKNFGVTFDQGGDGKIFESDSFKKWRSFWENHINKLGARWKEFRNAIFHDGDITSFLPERAWNEE